MALTPAQIRYLNQCEPGEPVSHALSELLFNDHDRLRHLELYPDSEDVEAKTVFPDVIVHRRGTQQNHLVLEFKKSTSRVDRRIDLLKLQGYKQQLGYDHALFVEVGTEGQSIITALEWV